MARRITRKQLKEDEFVSAMDQLIRKTRDYWKPAAIALGAVIVVVFFWWMVDEWSQGKTEEASALLADAVTSFNEAMVLEPVGDLSEAEAGFAEVVDGYGRTDQADVARMYQAKIALGRGETDTAREILVRLTQRHKDDALGRVAALELIRLRVASGQGAEVAQELEAMVVGRNTQLPRDLALYQLGEVFVEEQKLDQAKEYFQKLIDEFPESPYRAQAQQRLTELG